MSNHRLLAREGPSEVVTRPRAPLAARRFGSPSRTLVGAPDSTVRQLEEMASEDTDDMDRWEVSDYLWNGRTYFGGLRHRGS